MLSYGFRVTWTTFMIFLWCLVSIRNFAKLVTDGLKKIDCCFIKNVFYVPYNKQDIWVKHDILVSKWWQNFIFWANWSFNLALFKKTLWSLHLLMVQGQQKITKYKSEPRDRERNKE